MANIKTGKTKKQVNNVASSILILRCYRALQNRKGPVLAGDVATNFGGTVGRIRDAFNCLIKLGIVEEVSVVYKCATGLSVSRTVFGYALKRKI